MTTASIVIVKSTPDDTFTVRLEFPDGADGVSGLRPKGGEVPVVMLDRFLGNEGYERVRDWQYDVAEGYLVAEIRKTKEG